MNAFQRNIQETDLEDVAETLLSAVALTYDPHTDYMGARQVDRFKISMGTELTGIGACWAVKTTVPPKLPVSLWEDRLTNPEN